MSRIAILARIRTAATWSRAASTWGAWKICWIFTPSEGTESTTVGGLVTEWLGHVPEVGEEIERDGISIKVLAANHLRVDQVRVAKAANGHE